MVNTKFFRSFDKNALRWDVELINAIEVMSNWYFIYKRQN